MPIVSVLFLTACVLFLFLWSLIRQIFEEVRRVRHIRTWAAVTAEIVDSQVIGEDSEDDKFQIRVGYRYNISGAAYSGAGDVWGESKEPAKDLSQSYRLGQGLHVAYNPHRPAETVIADERHNSIKPGTIVSWIIGIGLTVFLISLMLSVLVAELSAKG